MKVFILTAGEYSDYHVVGVFSDKDKIAQFVKRYNQPESYQEPEDVYDDFNEPLEMEIDDSVSYTDPDNRFYDVSMSFNGDNASARETEFQWTYRMYKDKPMLINRKTNEVELYVFAKTPKQAIQVLNDKRTQYIAQNGGFNEKSQ